MELGVASNFSHSIMNPDNVFAENIQSHFFGKTTVDEREKYFITFPYPYMNGRLHIGHAFTLKKVDVLARARRMMGFNVMFPFGFHGTGTPIVACADKVKNELCTFTNGDELENTSQLGILEMMGVDRAEFPKFIDPNYWLEYFPAVAKQDLKKFGISADLERSFITTELNPHYDSFIKWQFEKLHRSGMLEFGKRFMVYDPNSNQPCSDHDRSVGEGVEPQEYTLIKLKIVGENINLLAGTLRPETIYGQTNVWVNRDGTYSLFSIGASHYVARYETFLNLSYQQSDVTLINKEYFRGSDMIGKFVQAPFVEHPIEILHMDAVSMKRGTGIVTSVPTDSPTDYLYWKKHLGKIPDLVGIIRVGESTKYAADEIEKTNVDISNTKKIDEIHEKVYMTENKEGILLVGKYVGTVLNEAREHIRKDLIDTDNAMIYYEPQSSVVSRSGIECVVALTDQWYINYGDSEHTKKVNEHINFVLEMYDDTAKANIKQASDWINKWPVSRLATRCLGTKLPVDERYMIDSLSDSTIYFAYYTICNTVTNIPISVMTFDTWEYIFGNSPLPESAKQFETQFIKMRNEFNYWYPMDMRISGSDLIGNHLTMALYNHSIIWPDNDMMPRAYYTNGHAMLNDKKMSKSTGNFLTLSDAIDKYSADGVHVALAQAGDGLGHANFNGNVARDAIVFLNTEFAWVTETLRKTEEYKNDHTYDFSSKATFWDEIFMDEMNDIINRFVVNIHKINIRKAFICVYDMTNIRNEYRNINNNVNIFSNRNRKVYHDNIKLYMKNFITILSIFCPFWTERLRSVVDVDKIFGELKWFSMETIHGKGSWAKSSMFELAKQVRNKHNKLTKKFKKDYNLEITVYTRHEDDIVNISKTLMTEMCDMVNVDIAKKFFDNINSTCKDKEMKKKIGTFSNICTNNVGKFGAGWLDWTSNGETYEFDIIKEWFSKIVDVKFANIKVNSQEISSTYKNGPGYPSFVLCCVE